MQNCPSNCQNCKIDSRFFANLTYESSDLLRFSFLHCLTLHTSTISLSHEQSQTCLSYAMARNRTFKNHFKVCAMYGQRRDISSLAATLPTGKTFLPQVKYVPENLAVSEFCVNTHTHTFARHINLYLFARQDTHFRLFSKDGRLPFFGAFAFSCPYPPIVKPHK